MINLKNYYFSGERPAQAILHDLSNKDIDENVDITSSQSQENNCTTMKRKNNMENIDYKKRRTEGKIIAIFFPT
jgi:hypothetical protein